MRYPKFALPVAVSALLVLMAACGPTGPTAAADPTGSDSLPGFTTSGIPGVSMSAMPGMSASAASGAAATAVAVDSVAIRNFAFAPQVVTVAVGATVTWTNNDQDAHTVAATDGSFKSAALNTGGTFRFTFTKPGRYEYLCTIHPFMTATVVVTP